MTSPAARPAFTKAEALAHTERLNASIDETLDLIFEAWVGSIWEGLDDVSDWDSYVDVYAPRIKTLRLPVEQRRAVVKVWAAAGMPSRAMARGLNVSNGTAATDAKAVVPVEEAGKVRDKNGTLRPRRILTVVPEAAPVLTQFERALALITAAGARGVTVKEMCSATGWHHGTASSVLSRAHNKRGVIAPVGPTRDFCNAYVLV